MNPKTIADEMLAVIREKGQFLYGEQVTNLQHALQCAALAEEEGYDEEVVLAAFLHDIGHLFDEGNELMDIYGTRNHDAIGAQYLRARGFSEKVCSMVGGHVDAKRYLTYKDSDYYDQLSHASKETLKFQGGPMSKKEAEVFESNPYHEMVVKLRLWDDEGKVPEIPSEEAALLKYHDMIIRYLETR